MTTRMAMRNRTLLGVGVVVGLAATLPAADEPSLSIFITAAKVEARKALEKQLKEQLGKKRESWPPEKDEELYRLEEAAALADADYEYRKIDPKAIGDAVEDLARAAEGKGLLAGKKDRVTIAGSAAEADLVVEVMARRSQKQLGAVVPSDCWVLFSIGPGAKTDAARFAKISVTYRPRKLLLAAWKIASPTAETPVFTFEGYNGGGSPVSCHGAAANSAAGLVDKFIEDNCATLAAK